MKTVSNVHVFDNHPYIRIHVRKTVNELSNIIHGKCDDDYFTLQM
jgi:hypothetical protein